MKVTVTATDQSGAMVSGDASASITIAPVSKVLGGLVCVDPSKLAAVSKYGVNKIALKIPWSVINPSNGTYDWSFIDGYLNNPAYAGVRFKLRPQAGDSAPGWLKAITGTVSCYNAARGITVNPCKWWTPVARDAWQAMINAAGARYDSNPRVVMVSADLPMVVYSEPYILGNDNATAIRLFNAGLTKEVQLESISLCVDQTAAAFPNTPVELAIHGDLQYPTATGVKAEWPIGRKLALDLCIRHGKHLVLSDYGLGVTDTAANHVPTGTIETEPDVYAWMRLRANGRSAPWAGPISFQLTVGKEPQTFETYRVSAQNARDLGAIDVETAGWGLLGASAADYDADLKRTGLLWYPAGATLLR